MDVPDQSSEIRLAVIEEDLKQVRRLLEESRARTENAPSV
jgi:hypothetical protein